MTADREPFDPQDAEPLPLSPRNGRGAVSKSYPEFLDDMGKLLQAAMPRTDRERDELFAAEAEVRRLRSQLAVAEERQELARKRYDRERAVLMEMFGTWKGEVMGPPEPDDGEP